MRFSHFAWLDRGTVPLRARFATEGEAAAAARDLEALGGETCICCDDEFGFDLDFVEHPLTTSLVAVLACGQAGMLIGAIASGVVPGVAGWVVGPVPGPVVIGGGAAAVGGLTALLICLSALRDYRPPSSLTVVRARVPVAQADEAAVVVLQGHSALDMKVGSRPERPRMAGD